MEQDKKISDFTTDELKKMKEAFEKGSNFKYLDIVNEIERRQRLEMGLKGNIDTIKT